jgi:hypothetical protein
MSHRSHGLRTVFGERSWQTRWKVALTVVAIVILIVLASRASVQPTSCGLIPAASVFEGGLKCG